MVTPNMEAPKPTPSSLAPLRPTAALRCASDHGCLPAGTTCGDSVAFILAKARGHYDASADGCSAAQRSPYWGATVSAAAGMFPRTYQSRLIPYRSSIITNNQAMKCFYDAHLEGVVGARAEEGAEFALLRSLLGAVRQRRSRQPHQHEVSYQRHDLHQTRALSEVHRTGRPHRGVAKAAGRLAA